MLYLNSNEKKDILFTSETLDLEVLTNIDTKYDQCWSFTLCDTIGNSNKGFSCKYVRPKVTVIPSAVSGGQIGSHPYRILHIAKQSNEELVGLSQLCYIGASNEKPFTQTYLLPKKLSVHNSSTWDIISKGITIKINSDNLEHKFPYIHNSLFAYDIQVESINGNPTAHYKPMLQQKVNDKEIKYYFELEAGKSNRITFHQDKNSQNKGLHLRFFTDDQVLKINIRFDWYGTLGRYVLRYGAVLANYFWISTLLILLTQIYSYAVNGKQEFTPYLVAFTNCLKKPFLQLGLVLVITFAIRYFLVTQSALDQTSKLYILFKKYMLFDSDDPLMISVLFIAFYLSIGITTIAWLLVKVLVSVISFVFGNLLQRVAHSVDDSNTSSAMTRLVVHLSIVIGAIKVVPTSVLFMFYFLIWILMTSTAQIQAKSNLPHFQNTYRYRQSISIFLVSLLPYYVPPLIIYIKDVLIGWSFRPTSTIVLQDLPILTVLVFLVTLGKNPDIIELNSIRYTILIINGLVLYQLIFGFQNPFILTYLKLVLQQ